VLRGQRYCRAAARLPLDLAQTAEDGDVRWNAAQALGQLGNSSDAARLLLDLAKTTEDDLVRILAAQALGELGQKDTPVLTVLLEMAKRGDRPGSIAYEALKELKPPRLLPAE